MTRNIVRFMVILTKSLPTNTIVFSWSAIRTSIFPSTITKNNISFSSKFGKDCSKTTAEAEGEVRIL